MSPVRPFDYRVADSQGFALKPLDPSRFDADGYADYAARLDEVCGKFWQSSSGLLVYRRFRSPEVFSYGCADMKQSLAMQLAGLSTSMRFKTDVPNFLEPWYGNGALTAAFGADYEWPSGQAPSVRRMFQTVEEAISAQVVPVERTPTGRHILNMIEFFLEQTRARVPISLTDTQSPMNVALFLVDPSNLFLAMYDNPQGVKDLMDRIVGLQLEFARKQMQLIGTALAKPGHGFASSTAFDGLGMSDDHMLMLSDEQYREFEIPYMAECGRPFGGAAFHSCGNWSAKVAAVLGIPGLQMVDGAFSPQTDPCPNQAEPFAALRDSGVCLNARIVGDADTVVNVTKTLHLPGMKSVIVTYCDSPEEQALAHQQLHSLNG